MLLAAGLTLCRDQGQRFGVTEVPGEPAPRAKAVFTRLPKPPGSSVSPGSTALLQTPGVMLAQSSQWWMPGCTGKEENTEQKRDPSPSLQLLKCSGES